MRFSFWIFHSFSLGVFSLASLEHKYLRAREKRTETLSFPEISLRMDFNRIGGTAGFWNNHEGLHEG